MNYLAIIVAAIAAFAVGGLWYGPLFGKKWRHLMSVTEGSMSQHGASSGTHLSMPQAMTGGFIATLVLCFVLSVFVGALGINTWSSAVLLALWIWLGFVATILLNSVFYERRPWALYLINASHYLVAIVVAALIITLW